MTIPNHPITVPFAIDKLIEICRRNDVTLLGLFGSMARGAANAQSDIDLLVRFSRPKSLVAVIALEQQLAVALEREVDLLTEAAVSPYLRDRILRDLQVLYEAR
jgi:predicted nucleotidyltransferase